uniref:Uncharacterized protein n=1 Tax=Alexandrium catenella TaxID=2925 RepID=A0A7S1L4J9_ALECA|mmetsp:Transcript_105851/g.281939  ORF Transcript_105851/g.281939 Transcript_105851/m.281939 type:complete len:122 (+) Transcript_105851:93-458(+)|eukprot:UN0084
MASAIGPACGGTHGEGGGDGSVCTSWVQFVDRLLQDQEIDHMRRAVRECFPDIAASIAAAYDKAVVMLLRMHVAFQHAYAKAGRSGHFVTFFEALVPTAALAELPHTRAKLHKYRNHYGIQ